jgi:Fe2+ or Zn2+ uptake regulation protein
MSPHRTALVAVLAGHSSFRSVAQLHDELRARGHRIALITVYRHLEIMRRQGGVAMVTGDRGEARYRAWPATTEQHALVCGRCQDVVDVSSPAVTRWAQAIAAHHGFVDVQVRAMVTGVCPRCSPVPR